MSIVLCPGNEIETIDLTSDSEPKKAPTNVEHTQHFDVQLYVLNHQQSLRNKTTIWHRNAEGSFHATEQLNPSLYHRERKLYLDRDGQVDEQWANQKWQQWSERDFHPAVEAFLDYNDPNPETIVLNNLKQSLNHGDTALQSIWAEVACAEKVLEITAMAPKSRVSDGMPAAIKDILADLAGHLRFVQSAQEESKRYLASLGLAVRSLIRAKSISEKVNRRREAEDEKMIDTVKSLKECLENHSRLVDIVLGRSEPLVQQGTDLMQAMLSEMFGLPAPVMREFEEAHMHEVGKHSMEETDEGSARESESESELTEFSEEETSPQDCMDIEAVEDSETDSDGHDSKNILSDASDGLSEYGRRLEQEKRERRLRQERRQRVRDARESLYKSFGLTVEETEEDQNDIHEEEDRRIKRQKRNTDTQEGETFRSNITVRKQPAILRQTTLGFNKIRKSRRLFSRKELSQEATPKNDQEEAEGSVRSNPRRTSSKRPDYCGYFLDKNGCFPREQQTKGDRG